MNDRTLPIENFMKTIAANVDNEKLDDEGFRRFLRNTLPIVEGIDYQPKKKNTITFVPPDNKYVPKIGDIDVYGLDGWLTPLTVEDFSQNLQPLPLSYINFNGWNALGKFMDTEFLCNFMQKITYECPFTNSEYITCVPFCILAEDIKPYLQYCHNPESAAIADIEWTRNDVYHLKDSRMGEEDVFIPPDDIERCILGPGYNLGIIPSDGFRTMRINADIIWV